MTISHHNDPLVKVGFSIQRDSINSGIIWSKILYDNRKKGSCFSHLFQIDIFSFTAFVQTCRNLIYRCYSNYMLSVIHFLVMFSIAKMPKYLVLKYYPKKLDILIQAPNLEAGYAYIYMYNVVFCQVNPLEQDECMSKYQRLQTLFIIDGCFDILLFSHTNI